MGKNHINLPFTKELKNQKRLLTLWVVLNTEIIEIYVLFFSFVFSPGPFVLYFTSLFELSIFDCPSIFSNVYFHNFSLLFYNLCFLIGYDLVIR